MSIEYLRSKNNNVQRKCKSRVVDISDNTCGGGDKSFGHGDDQWKGFRPVRE